MNRLFFFVLYLLFGSTANSQSKLAEVVRVQLLKDWELTKVLTNEYLNTMPEDKYSFKAHDSIRSFAQQMLHLAQATVAMASHGTGAARLFPKETRLEQSPGAQAKDSVFYYVNACYDYVINAIRKMDLSKLDEKIKVRDMEETRLGWILKAFDHQTHHRGQTAIYIRLVGLTPPKWIE
jgi:uncharacterized damage-inducible protein DinB